jgi:hypothetical protein
MGQKLVIGPINRGIKTDRTAFNIDNDSFPTLVNAYQWRGRIKRKRGTSLLGRLQRYIGTTDGAGSATITIAPVPIASGTSTFVIGTDIFLDPGGASPVTLVTNSAGSGTLNRSTGVLTITGSNLSTAVVFIPGLPVMGLRDLLLISTQFPGTIGFDTDYAYNISTAAPYSITDISYYKNPASATYPAYVAKGTWTPTTWNGANYQQFWTTNYQGAFWATNGIDVPFTGGTIGMQFGKITALTITTAGNGTTVPAVVNITIGAGTPLVIGDFVFINEVVGVTGINFQTGYVTAVAGAVITVTFPNAIIAGARTSGGIVQYLTNRSNTLVDSLRWYDGNPTNGLVPPGFLNGLGWVNFAPPLSQSNFSIGGLPPAQYYLVGARIIIPFKDRLLFFGPVVQTSGGTPQYLQDTVIYSQNGTPFYTASYFNTPNAAIDTPASATNVFNPILVPINKTGAPNAYFCDQTGFGGFITAGVQQPIITVGVNEDVLIVGFSNFQTRFIYSGNDIVPFNFFIINSELGSGSTFSAITMDKSVFTRGSRGIIATSQVGAERLDLDIPDQVFEISLLNNGSERVTAQRDFISEWLYLTYPINDDNNPSIFPSQTLQYNYRDNSWAIFNESYTTYGQFKISSTPTWLTVTATSWNAWTEPWNAGESTALQPIVIAGNQQGFVLFRERFETSEGTSLAIMNIVGSTVTSPNHNLDVGDYIMITGVQGSIASEVNGLIFSVAPTSSGSITASTFNLSPNIVAGTYLAGGLITRLYVPQIQTKQFPVAWEQTKKTRLGAQQYLLTSTDNAQITLLIFLSQNSTSAYNTGNIVPSSGVDNNALIYSTTLYTCPESTNLGLIPSNINLQMVTAAQQAQIWHRVNTSLLGDTVQLGFTLSDTQMRGLDASGNLISQFAEIELHSIILDCSPSMTLS